MKAAVLEGIKDIKIKDLPIPEISDDEVLIQIKAVGLCGSDLHYYNEGKLNRRIVTKPLILGHESSGIVKRIGKNVNHLAEGDKVAIEPGIACGKCDICKAGRYNECKKVVFIAAPPNDGALAEFIKHNSSFVHKIPDNITFEQAALIEPLSVGYYSAKKVKIKPGDNVCILGSGPIGLSCLEMAKSFGAAKIFISDISDYRLAIAKKHNAYRTINVLKQNLKEVIDAETNNAGVDIVIESSGAESSIKQSLEICCNCGRVAWLGMGKNEILIPYIEAIYKDLTIEGIFRYANTYVPIIRMIEMSKIDFTGFVTHRFKLDDIVKAIDIASNPDIDKMKIIIYM